jgi:sigma-E factor negative regulatory protein RseC
MNSFSCIEQRGIVESADKDIVSVKISQVSACSDCHSKSSCLIFGTGEKTVKVHESSGEFHPGDRVGVTITQTTGNKAVFLGYFIPFLLVILTLVVFTLLHFSEWQAGLLALSILIPYYLLLYFSRTRLRKTFSFTLKKLD